MLVPVHAFVIRVRKERSDCAGPLDSMVKRWDGLTLAKISLLNK